MTNVTNNDILLLKGDDNMELVKGQKAKAVAGVGHLFEDGTKITFVEMDTGYSEYVVYVFEGVYEGGLVTQDLIEGEFELIKDGE